MKAVYRVLFGLHAFVGLGAMAGGLGAILNPYGPMGVSTDILRNAPFETFLIPGILLFSVIGIGNLLGAMAICLKAKYQVYISGVLSGALMIWIIVQCIMLYAVNYLHVIFFSIGAAQAALSLMILIKSNLYPASFLISQYKRLNKGYSSK